MSENHSNYYVPEYSRLPVLTAFGLFCLGYGSLNILHSHVLGPTVFCIGLCIMALIMFFWFRETIREGKQGLHDEQMERSYRWGMVWFIFSELMFFGIFFFALIYVRFFGVPNLGGDLGTSQSALTQILLWPNFHSLWPLFKNPNQVAFPGPLGTLSTWGIPALNTLILLSSAVTVTWAHWSLKRNRRTQLILGLIFTIGLGATFLFFQAHEYMMAHMDYHLKLSSGIYGSTFFTLTGFHAIHVTIGVIMLTVILFRCLKGHFTPHDHFGFEATAWYWHFVDVVWLCLFIFVYWI
jgi:cytochrome c oxidase subunit III